MARIISAVFRCAHSTMPYLNRITEFVSPLTSLTSNPLLSFLLTLLPRYSSNAPGMSTSGPWHLLFSLPRMFFLQLSAWFTPFPPADLCSNVTFSVRFSLPTLLITATPPLYSPADHPSSWLYFSPWHQLLSTFYTV